jgi:hypothetical protein
MYIAIFDFSEYYRVINKICCMFSLFHRALLYNLLIDQHMHNYLCSSAVFVLFYTSY